MLIKKTYTADDITFDSYVHAWDYLWARKYPSVLLMDKNGEIVHSCELASVFIVDNKEQVDFVRELLWHTNGEVITYKENVTIERSSLIIRDSYDDYVVRNEKEVKKEHSEINDVLVDSYSPQSAVRRYYQI